MIRQEHLVMTFAGGEDHFFMDPTFWVWAKSVKQIPNTDAVILTHQMSDYARSRLEDMDIHVVNVTPGELHYLYRDRHLCFWEYLNDHGHKYKHVLVCDCRDVVFQADPFEWINKWRSRYEKIHGTKNFLNEFVIMTAEGHKMSQSGFACIEHFEFERDVPRPFLKEDRSKFVINGGTFLGTPRALQDWHFLVWITQLKTMGRCTDQATVNWVMRYLENDDKYSVSFPQHDNLCLTGEGVKEGAVEPLFKDGLLLSPQGEIYCMVHQWDRLDHVKEAVLERYV